MSTSALIIYQDCNNNCFATSINFDGYIEDGVGELLYNHWNNENDIIDLCVNSDKCIRSFASSKNNIEYYDDFASKKFANSLKNLSYCTMLNKTGNYDYSYLWNETEKEWYVFHSKYGKKLLKSFF